MNDKSLPCWFCCEKCGFIMMSHCEKLNFYLKIRNFDKNDDK